MTSPKNTALNETQIFRRDFRKTHPYETKIRIFHLISLWVLVPGSIAVTFSQLNRPGLADFGVIILMLLFGNLVIHLVHRFLLHIPIKFFSYPYRIHTLIHHRYFTDDEYQFSQIGELDVILFPVWFVFFITLIVSPAAGYLISIYVDRNTAFLVMMMINVNYFLYEMIHFSAHSREDSWINRFAFFRLMRRHHWLHHRAPSMSKYNFDVIFPFFDIVLGTFTLDKK